MWQQKQIQLAAKKRGFHLITADIEQALNSMQYIDIGLLHLQLLHTSASLTLNENADPLVRADMEAHFCHMVPENQPYYRHTYEGPDDMPAHIKSSLLGTSLILPINQSSLQLGMWQGVYLGEHRDIGEKRKLLLTLQGEVNA